MLRRRVGYAALGVRGAQGGASRRSFTTLALIGLLAGVHPSAADPIPANPLVVSKTADDDVSGVGEQNGYTITVSNPNALVIQVDEIEDTLPEGFAYVPGSTTGVTNADPLISAGVLTWTGPFDVGALGSISLSFDVTVSTVAGRYFNDATASSAQAAVTPANDTAKVVVSEDIIVTKTPYQDTTGVGEPNGYTVVVRNPNPYPITLDSVADSLPPGFEYLPGSTRELTTADPVVLLGVATWLGPFQVRARDFVILRFGVVVAIEPGDYLNEATVAASVEEGSLPVTPSGPTAQVTVTEQSIVVTKSADDPFADVGEEDGYTITIANPNAIPATVTSITDVLPPGFSYVAGSSDGATLLDPQITGQTLTWDGPIPVPADGETTLHFEVVVAQLPGSYLNEATATVVEFPVVPTGPTANITVTSLPLRTSKTADAPTAPVDGTNGYTITIENPNTAPVTLDTITDDLPVGFAQVPGSTTGVTTADPAVAGQTLTWAGPFVVPASDEVTLHFEVTVASVTGEFFNRAGGTAGPFTVSPTGRTAKIVVRAPTVMEAHPALLDLGPGGEILFPFLSATLTDERTGEPVRGFTIRFMAGTNLICRGVTDLHGVAACGGLVEEVYTVLALGYQAFFDGGGFFEPSSDAGPLVRLNGTEVP